MNDTPNDRDEAERLKRWRLVLGSEAQDSCGGLAGAAVELDQALAALYEPDGPNGLGAASRPEQIPVALWRELTV